MEKENISTRGRKFVGIVVADRMPQTVTVEWSRTRRIPKYERYEKRRTRVKAHNPKEINAKVGDVVRIVETRKLSKTKSFIVTEIVGHEEAVDETVLLSSDQKRGKLEKPTEKVKEMKK